MGVRGRGDGHGVDVTIAQRLGQRAAGARYLEEPGALCRLVGILSDEGNHVEPGVPQGAHVGVAAEPRAHHHGAQWLRRRAHRVAHPARSRAARVAWAARRAATIGPWACSASEKTSTPTGATAPILT